MPGHSQLTKEDAEGPVELLGTTKGNEPLPLPHSLIFLFKAVRGHSHRRQAAGWST